VLRVLGLPESASRVTIRCLRHLRELEDYEALRAWEALAADEKEAAYAVVSSWLRTTLGRAAAAAPQQAEAPPQPAPVLAAAVAEKEAQTKHSKWTLAGAGSGLALGVAVLGAAHIGVVAGAVAAGAAAYARTKPKPQPPPFPTLRESGAGVHEPMVRLLHLVPSLHAVAPGPAWAALLSEAEGGLLERFTDDWYRSCCASDFSRLSSSPRYAYAGVDSLPELRGWLAAVRSQSLSEAGELQTGQGVASAEQQPAVAATTVVASLPGRQQLQLVAHDGGGGDGGRGLWSLFQWQPSPSDSASYDASGGDGDGAAAVTLVVVFKGGSAGSYLMDAAATASVGGGGGGGGGGTEALPGCPCLHAHKATLRSLLLDHDHDSGSGGGSGDGGEAAVTDAAAAISSSASSSSSPLLRLRIALQPYRRRGYALRLVGHGPGGATALLALLQLMTPPRTEFEVDDEPPWTTSTEVAAEAEVVPDFQSIRAVGFGSPAVLALPPKGGMRSSGGGGSPATSTSIMVSEAVESAFFKASRLPSAFSSLSASAVGSSDTSRPGQPEVYENDRGVVRVRWQAASLSLAAPEMNNDDDHDDECECEFELEYGVVGPLGYFQIRPGSQWQAVRPMVTSFERFDDCGSDNSSNDDGGYRHAQAVSCASHGLKAGSAYLFRVRQRALLLPGRSSSSSSSSQVDADEAEEVGEGGDGGGVWSEWSEPSEAVKVKVDGVSEESNGGAESESESGAESVLKAKIAAAEQQLQKLFETQAEAVHIEQEQEQGRGMVPSKEAEGERATDAQAQRQDRLQRLQQTEPEPEPELAATAAAATGAACGGGAAADVRVRGRQRQRQPSVLNYMEELRTCAATHFDLVVNRGDLLPRILGLGHSYGSSAQGSQYAAAAAAASLSPKDTNAADGSGGGKGKGKGKGKGYDETGEVEMMLRHVMRECSATAAADDDDDDDGDSSKGGEVEAEQEEQYLDMANIGAAFSRYAHHGSVHIMHTDASSSSSSPSSSVSSSSSGADVAKRHSSGYSRSTLGCIGTVAKPSTGFDDSYRWLHLHFQLHGHGQATTPATPAGIGGAAGAAAANVGGVGGGYVFVRQTLADHSAKRYAATLARLATAASAAAAAVASNAAAAGASAAIKAKKPPPPSLAPPQQHAATAAAWNGKAKVRAAKISDEQPH
jgi:hypothetical protein